MDLEVTKKVVVALEREGVRYIIIGGIALNLLGLVRTTEDLDLFVAPERDNLERLKAALRSVFADPDIEEISTDELLGDYPAVQYIPPEGAFHLDILTRLGEAFQFQDLEPVRVDLDGQPVWVASPRTLYRMKRGTVRPKDWGDAATPELPSGGRLMPVRKFRSVEEMEGNVRYEPGSPELFRAIRALWELSARIFPRRFPPGVYRHRSIEDAQRQREIWEEADFRALWERRGVKPEEVEEKLKGSR